MRSIQEVGMEILNKTPKPFYVFCGSEYGIKNKYIQILSEVYNEVHEVQDVQSVLSMMSTKHIIPLKPSLYIVRYDDAFLTSLNSDTALKIKNTHIVGTIICIYDSKSKGVNKVDKYLGDYAVSIDKVDRLFVIKYLHGDFPKLPDRLINLAADMSENYGDAQNICKSMSLADVETIFKLSDSEITALFGKQTNSTDTELKKGIAARNFAYLISLLDNYPGDLDSIFYVVLSTLLELEKIKNNSYTDSELREYAKRWTYQDVYNMFMNTYEELKKCRSYANNIEASLIYLFSLLKFTEIPAVEVMR